MSHTLACAQIPSPMSGQSHQANTLSWATIAPLAMTLAIGGLCHKAILSAKRCWSTGRSTNGRSSTPTRQFLPKSNPTIEGSHDMQEPEQEYPLHQPGA